MRFLVTICLLAVIGCAAWFAYRYSVFLSEAELRAGITALKEGNYGEAFTKVMPFAKEGDAHAQFLVAYMYAFGVGVDRDDVRAEMWLRSRECRCPRAGQGEYDLAIEYFTGSVGLRNREAGVAWLRRAAEAGHQAAQRLLANPDELGKFDARVDQRVVEYWQGFVKDAAATGPPVGKDGSGAG